MDFYINPGAATDDAQQIESIVTTIQQAMEELDTAMKNDDTQVDWMDTVKSNWNSYYSQDVANGMEEMKDSARNLQLAVQEFTNYSMEK